MTIHKLKQTRPTDDEVAQLWKLYHAAERVTDRWHGSTVGPVAEELASTELSREEKMFLLRAWQVLVDGHLGFSRLMGSFDTYVYNVQDPDIGYVDYKPELAIAINNGQLFGVLLEAYGEALERIAELESVKNTLFAAQQRIFELESRTLKVKLPDPSSKAFWGGTGKAETFYPSTYRIWVKEAVERAGTIAQVNVEVK